MHIDRRREKINESIVDARLLTIIKVVEDPQFVVHVTFEEGSEQAFVAVWEIRSCVGPPAEGKALAPWTGIGMTGERFALVGRVSQRDLNFISNTPGVKYIWLHESELPEYEKLLVLLQEQEAVKKALAERAEERQGPGDDWLYWLQTGRNYPTRGSGSSEQGFGRH